MNVVFDPNEIKMLLYKLFSNQQYLFMIFKCYHYHFFSFSRHQSILMKRKVQLTFIRTDRLTDRPTDTYREYQYFGYLAMKKNEDKKKEEKVE